jgi:hypothetical protein
MLRVVRAPDVAGPGEVLMTGTPPIASLVTELNKSQRKSRCNDEPGPKVAAPKNETSLLRHREEKGVAARSLRARRPRSLRNARDHYKAPSFTFTVSLMVRPSAFLPTSAACAAFITFPMSFIDAAPVSLIAALTALSISFWEAACGR